MPQASVRIVLSKDPTLALVLESGKLALTENELKQIGERQIGRIQERTSRGIDIRGKAFAPYSSTGYYYFYPAGPNRSKLSRKRAAARLQRIVGGNLTRSGQGVRFESYAAFKRALGRGPNVDLMGPRAPHMMQSMVAWVEGGHLVIGFYDPEKARIAKAHNTGNRRLPKREFFGVSDEERDLIRTDAAQAVKDRLRKL